MLLAVKNDPAHLKDSRHIVDIVDQPGPSELPLEFAEGNLVKPADKGRCGATCSDDIKFSRRGRTGKGIFGGKEERDAYKEKASDGIRRVSSRRQGYF